MSTAHAPAPRHSRSPARRLPSILLLAATLSLGSCAAPGTVDAPAPPLHQIAGRYQVDQPLGDFYDSLFVLTDGGRSPPRSLTTLQVADLLLADDVVVYGENHAHAGIHLDEMNLFRALYARDRRWVLSLEQFERDTQDVLDRYLAGKIGEDALIDKARAWPNYTASYRPLLLFAREHHLPVVAAEAPGWAVSCVGQLGTQVLDEFTPADRAWVARDIHATPGPYRDKYMGFLGDTPSHGDADPHGGTDPHGNAGPHGEAAATAAKAKAARSFAAQVTRDDTMAESIDRALHDHPGFKVFHVTGHFHSEGFLGTVERLRLRDPAIKIGVIQPVEVDDPAKPGFSAAEAAAGTVLELVYPTPDEFVEGEDTSPMVSMIRHERAASHCKYGPAAPAAAPATPAPASPHPAN